MGEWGKGKEEERIEGVFWDLCEWDREGGGVSVS